MKPRSFVKAKKPAGIGFLISGNRQSDLQFQNLKERLENLETTPTPAQTTTNRSSTVTTIPAPSSPYFLFTQDVASVTWTVQHNLNTISPLVHTWDGSNEEIEGDVAITDADSIVITFSSSISGRGRID